MRRKLSQMDKWERICDRKRTLQSLFMRKKLERINTKESKSAIRDYMNSREK